MDALKLLYILPQTNEPLSYRAAAEYWDNSDHLGVFFPLPAHKQML